MSADDGIPSSQQVDQILGSSKLARAIENDRYKHLLDHVPVAIAVSRGVRAEQQVVYANKAFENLMSMMAGDVEGQSWTCLDGFLNEDDQSKTLGEAIRDGEDFIGVFRPAGPVDRLVIVQAYASVIESDDGVENFRIAAMVDVGGRERAQIEQFENQIRDRDMLMRELQHRVKNNLQLITALVRLEARSAAEGEAVALARLASRIDALTVLYRALSAEDATADIDQRGDPEIFDAVVTLDHRGIGLHDHQPIDRHRRTENTDEILAVADRFAQRLALVVFVEKAVETGPALALDIAGHHRHQHLERLVGVDDLLLAAGPARDRDGDRDMIEQMLVAVVLDRLHELRRAQNLIDLLGGRNSVVGAHRWSMLMDKP